MTFTTIEASANRARQLHLARIALLPAGYPVTVPGITHNRLCASGLSAVVHGFRAIALGEAEVVVAGGVESMTRAPYVLAKGDRAFAGGPPEIHDSRERRSSISGLSIPSMSPRISVVCSPSPEGRNLTVAGV